MQEFSIDRLPPAADLSDFAIKVGRLRIRVQEHGFPWRAVVGERHAALLMRSGPLSDDDRSRQVEMLMVAKVAGHPDVDLHVRAVDARALEAFEYQLVAGRDVITAGWDAVRASRRSYSSDQSRLARASAALGLDVSAIVRVRRLLGPPYHGARRQAEFLARELPDPFLDPNGVVPRGRPVAPDAILDQRAEQQRRREFHAHAWCTDDLLRSLLYFFRQGLKHPQNSDLARREDDIASALRALHASDDDALAVGGGVISLGVLEEYLPRWVAAPRWADGRRMAPAEVQARRYFWDDPPSPDDVRTARQQLSGVIDHDVQSLLGHPLTAAPPSCSSARTDPSEAGPSRGGRAPA